MPSSVSTPVISKLPHREPVTNMQNDTAFSATSQTSQALPRSHIDANISSTMTLSHAENLRRIYERNVGRRPSDEEDFDATDDGGVAWIVQKTDSREDDSKQKSSGEHYVRQPGPWDIGANQDLDHTEDGGVAYL